MYNHAEVHLRVCVQKTKRVYILYNQKLKNTKKNEKNKISKSTFYLAKWTHFTPDNTSLCDCITNDFIVQWDLSSPILMPESYLMNEQYLRLVYYPSLSEGKFLIYYLFSENKHG